MKKHSKEAENADIEQNKKDRSRIHKTIPIMITISMVLIILIQSLTMAYTIHEYLMRDIDMNTISKACQEIFAGNFITLGISIVAIAVSVWIGLNINVAIEKGELTKKIEALSKKQENNIEKHRENLKKFKVKQNEIAAEHESRYKQGWKQIEKLYVNNLKIEWCDKIRSLSDKYSLSGYLGNVLQAVDLGENIEFISALINYENDYIVMTHLYENDKWLECISKAKELMKKEFCNEINISEVKLYLEVRRSDILFYKCACEIRTGTKEDHIIEELEQSVAIYHSLEKEGHIATYEKRLEVYAYIYNTLGYSYDLMNQVNSTEERKTIAIEYMEKAVMTMKELGGKARGRYYRNLGLVYQKAERWDNAREAYENALRDNPEDYKCYVTIAGIILDNIDRALGIKYRTKLLYNMCDEFLPYMEEIKYAIELCEASICLSYVFEDPYYKIAQAYTYLYLGTGKQKKYIEEARKYMHKLQMRGFERVGYKFTLRNMYEALGNVSYAIKINNSIASTSHNDVERISKLYEEYGQNNGEVNIDKEKITLGERLNQESRYALQEDYVMLLSCLDVAVSLIKTCDTTKEEWSTLHGVIKGYLVDRANREWEAYTAYTEKIYAWCEELFEEINKRSPYNA